MTRRIPIEVQGTERFLNLQPRSRLLHLCCASGQLTLELARRGHRVLGQDDSEAALARARAAARSERLNVHFLKSDARHIPYRSEFDAVLSFSATFGVLPGERDDLRTLESAHKALKPEGWLLLELLNKERVVREFSPKRLDRVSFNCETGRLDEHGVVTGKDGRPRPSFVSRRLYALTEIKALIAGSGLLYLQSWGDFDGSPYDLESPRLIVLARKPPQPSPARPRPQGGEATIRIKGRAAKTRP